MTLEMTTHTDRGHVATLLQDALTDLIELGLLAKHAHWNVVGPRFRSVHLQLDELVAIARDGADDVAERLAATGGCPDGRPTSLARGATTAGGIVAPMLDVDVVDHIVDLLAGVTARLRLAIDAGAEEPVTQDLLIGVVAALEKQAWMFGVQRAR